MTSSEIDKDSAETSASPELLNAIAQMEAALGPLYRAASLPPPRRTRLTPPDKWVQADIERRKVRLSIFPDGLFFDPAWDILLELYARQLQRISVYTTQLQESIPIPFTTVLRWLDRLEAEALVVRNKDPHDARKVRIALSQYGRDLMDRWLNQATTDPDS